MGFNQKFVLQITKLELPFDKMRNQRRNYCFIEFESEEAVDKICENAGHQIGSREVSLLSYIWMYSFFRLSFYILFKKFIILVFVNLQQTFKCFLIPGNAVNSSFVTCLIHAS